jgi:hypothetical protein
MLSRFHHSFQVHNYSSSKSHRINPSLKQIAAEKLNLPLYKLKKWFHLSTFLWIPQLFHFIPAKIFKFFIATFKILQISPFFINFLIWSSTNSSLSSLFQSCISLSFRSIFFHRLYQHFKSPIISKFSIAAKVDHNFHSHFSLLFFFPTDYHRRYTWLSIVVHII